MADTGKPDTGNPDARNPGAGGGVTGLESASELAAMIAAGTLTSSGLLELYLQRIEDLNGDINAVVTFDLDRARAAAAEADAAVARGDALGPLHGLPITVKDAIATEGIRSTGGAIELADHVPSDDAPIVTAVKDAGAIVFGKTNLPRWSGDVQAYNDMFGVTGNPWDTTRTPGGSSGGASAAVSAGLTSFELGTDIGGSVRLPAHFAGVCGHKPSFGLVPQLGYIDHPTGGRTEADVNVFGPLARSVDDLELLLDVVAGPPPDRAGAWKLALPPPRQTELADFRVAAWLDDDACRVGPNVGALLSSAVDALRGAGATIDDTARPETTIDEVWTIGLPLISAATSPGRRDDDWAEQVRRADDPSLDDVTRMRYQASVIRHRDWLLLTEERDLVRQRWAEFFQMTDILLCPVAITEAFPHTLEGDLYSRTLTIDGDQRPYAEVIAWTSMIGYAYLPSTVVPIGLTPDGLPVGMQIVAPFCEDRTALAFARHVERLCQGYRVPPIAG